MVGFSISAIPALVGVPLAQASNIVPPALTVVLCAVAAVGTLLLLPARYNTSLRPIGGIVLAAAAAILAAFLARAASTFGQQMGVYFWIFSAIALFGAVRVITHSKPVYSAMYFVLTVLATAGLFVLLWAEFMAIALVIIYAGAILVTYVFVIMLATEASPPQPNSVGTHDSGAIGGLEHDEVSREPIAATVVAFVLLAVLLTLIFDISAAQPPLAIGEGDRIALWGELGVTGLGYYLFQEQAVSLELAGLILTMAMVGAIMIARRRVVGPEPINERGGEVQVAPMTPINDNPHSIPVYGTQNPSQKAYPET